MSINIQCSRLQFVKLDAIDCLCSVSLSGVIEEISVLSDEGYPVSELPNSMQCLCLCPLLQLLRLCGGSVVKVCVMSFTSSFVTDYLKGFCRL
jgi:hypothetical protein